MSEISVDSDVTVHMCRLTRVYTGQISHMVVMRFICS